MCDTGKEHARSWMATGNISIYANYRVYRADYGVAAREDSTAASAGPNRNDQLRRWHRIIGEFQRCGHVSSYRASDQQHIGMFRGGNEVNSESLQIVVGVGKGENFSCAAIARPGIDLPDIQRPPNQRTNLLCCLR